jgi:hypothetical protein
MTENIYSTVVFQSPVAAINSFPLATDDDDFMEAPIEEN